MTTADCGAACLTMVLRYYGRQMTLREVRESTGTGRGATSALALLEAAAAQGLKGRGVKVATEDVSTLPAASILHWSSCHFVVFEGVTRKGVTVVDPAIGRRTMPLARFAEEFAGTALVLEPGEEFEPGGRLPRSGVRRYLAKILEYRWFLARVLATSVAVQLLALSLPLLTGAIVDRIVPQKNQHLLLLIAFGLAVVVTFQFVLSLTRANLLLHLSKVLETRLSLGFIEHLVSLPYGFFLDRPAGDLLARWGSHRALREALTSAALSTLIDGTLVTLYLVLLMTVSAPMGALVVFFGCLQIALYGFARRRYRELTARDLEITARSQSRMMEILAGIETLKTMGAEQRAVESWSCLFFDELNVSIARGRLGALVESLMSALRMTSPLAILVLGSLLVIAGRLSLGVMLALNALAAGFLTPLGKLVTTALTIQEIKSHVERIDDVLDALPEQPESPVSPAPVIQGAITLEGVSFRYGKHQPLALSAVTTSIAAGQKVGIVGRSGAGKSTLARMMAGLFRPESGRVLLDGRDLTEMDLQKVRSQIGVVSQRSAVFGGTIRQNIALSEETLPLSEVRKAAKRAQIHRDIEAMPLGYETRLTAAGATLSGGQRQRIALARALVHQPAILLLDEATSELDTVTESRILSGLATLGCTRIVVAHRLSTIWDADLILVLEGGRLVEHGTHEELVARGGVYAELVEAQRRMGLASSGGKKM